jgi:hypothetical protein
VGNRDTPRLHKKAVSPAAPRLLKDFFDPDLKSRGAGLTRKIIIAKAKIIIPEPIGLHLSHPQLIYYFKIFL